LLKAPGDPAHQVNIKTLQALLSRADSATPLDDDAVLRALAHGAAELAHISDPAEQEAAAGQLAVALIRLCNIRGWDLGELAQAAIANRHTVGKKIALIGTSASPITNGHLTMGLEILALTDVDMVWYYLVGKHPWGKKLMPAAHRVEMVRRATDRYPRMTVCDYEVIHGEHVYADTMETAQIMERHFIPDHPEHEFSWVMGSDVAQTFHEWGGAEWMAENMRIFIIHRLGYDFDKDNSILADKKHQYLKEDIVTSNISSTLVRKRGRDYDQRRVMALVPEVVWNYLVAEQLLDPEVMGR
jgi:nicotinate (nicotinamide) nucleotide adenylyltransferase